MQIRFAPAVPSGCPVLAILVGAGPLGAATLPGIDPAGVALAQRAAEAARFEGEAGSVAELFVARDGAPQRLLLAGLGKDRKPEAFERAGPRSPLGC